MGTITGTAIVTEVHIQPHRDSRPPHWSNWRRLIAELGFTHIDWWVVNIAGVTDYQPLGLFASPHRAWHAGGPPRSSTPTQASIGVIL